MTGARLWILTAALVGFMWPARSAAAPITESLAQSTLSNSDAAASATPTALPTAVITATPPLTATTVVPTATISATAAPSITATASITPPTPTVTPTASLPTVAATPAPPIGRWVSPANHFVVRGDVLSIAVRAAPATPGGAAIDHITIWARWPGGRPSVICTIARPAADTVDLYACNWNVTASGVPNGALGLSFDVYDRAGLKRVAPDGERQGTVQQPIRRIIVFLQGVCTSIDTGTDLTNGTFNGLYSALKRDGGYHDSDFLLYSYKGGSFDKQGRWRHRAYGTLDPIRQDLRTTSWTALHDDLLVPYHARHPNTTFVLVGHSLGGVVAFQEIERYVDTPAYRHGFIAGVVTIDSPLHGVRPTEVLLSDLVRIYPRIGSGLDCVVGGRSARVLTDLYQNGKTTHDLAVAAERAHRQGVAIATIGNLDDCVWAPDRCGAPPIGNVRTQWIDDPDVRQMRFTIPKPCLGRDKRCFIGTHGAAINRRDGPDALRAIATYIGRQV